MINEHQLLFWSAENRFTPDSEMRLIPFCSVTFFLFLKGTVLFAQLPDPPLSTLSSLAYAQEAKAIAARKPAVRYPQKSQQNVYENFIRQRDHYLASQLEDDEIIADAAALARCNTILQRMQRSAPAYPFHQIRVFINRSAIPNAACYGEGTLQVNLGLLLLLANDEELAFVMGHELAHQFLGHLDSTASHRVALQTNASIRKEVRAIGRSSGNRYEKLRALQATLAAERGNFSRQHEIEADSLGLLLAKSAGYEPAKSARLLLRFQHVDELFTGSRLYDVGAAFSPAGVSLPGVSKTKYVGLSSVKVTINATADLDSMRQSHPDCILRWRQLNGGASVTPPAIENMQAMLARADAYKQTAFAEIVRYLFEARRLTQVVHFCLLAKANGCTAPYFDNMIAAGFAQIVAEDAGDNRFEATHTGMAVSGSTLKELQDLIVAQNAEAAGRISAYFLQKHPRSNSESALFARALYEKHIGGKPAAVAATAYLSAYPNGTFSALLKDL